MALTVIRDGVHTRLESPLCMSCPQGVTGCCAAPPVVAWADIARIVTRGGARWLLDELAAARLYPCARGLALQRVENPDVENTGRERKCVYHGARGCTLPHDRRSATCNYYVCDDAAEGDIELRDELTAFYGEADLILSARVATHGVEWTVEFLTWLANEWTTHTERRRRPTGSLR